MNHKHEFGRPFGNKGSWRCTLCGIEDTRSEIEFVQDEVKKERERIIELLETERRQCEKAGLFANGLELREQLQTLFIGLEMAIALIKGENK